MKVADAGLQADDCWLEVQGSPNFLYEKNSMNRKYVDRKYTKMIFFKFPITWQTSFDYFLYSSLEPERPALLYKKWLLSSRKFRP